MNDNQRKIIETKKKKIDFMKKKKLEGLTKRLLKLQNRRQWENPEVVSRAKVW